MTVAETLAKRLLAVARVYAATRGNKLSSVGQKIAGDRQFFTNIVAGQSRFSARSYDQVMQKFSDAWPEGAVWPLGVPRPAPINQGGGDGEDSRFGGGPVDQSSRRAG